MRDVFICNPPERQKGSIVPVEILGHRVLSPAAGNAFILGSMLALGNPSGPKTFPMEAPVQSKPLEKENISRKL